MHLRIILVSDKIVRQVGHLPEETRELIGCSLPRL
jgi:hypothetical protein